MRGWTATFVILLSALVIVALFQFLFKSQMDKQVAKLQAENSAAHKQLTDVEAWEVENAQEAEEIPRLKSKVLLYQAAIPAKVDDDVFFKSVTQELERNGVQLLGAQLQLGGSFVGDAAKEEDLKKYTEIGVDEEALKQVKVAFYQLKLLGDYGKTISALENLKGQGRMYSIDAVVSPAGGGGGTVTQTLDASKTPIQVTGRIYYGVQGNIGEDALDLVLDKTIIKPLANKQASAVSKEAKELVKQQGTSKQGSGNG